MTTNSSNLSSSMNRERVAGLLEEAIRIVQVDILSAGDGAQQLPQTSTDAGRGREPFPLRRSLTSAGGGRDQLPQTTGAGGGRDQLPWRPSASTGGGHGTQQSPSRRPRNADEVNRLFQPYPVHQRRARSAPVRNRVSSWVHTFCCLSSVKASAVPSSAEKAKLTEAGFGMARIVFPDREGDSAEFEETLIGQFPKLKEGGGFDLLKSVGGNSKVLEIVKCPDSGYSAKYFREQAFVRSGIIYIRPLQQDLDDTVAPVQSPATVKCIHCMEYFSRDEIRQHATTCQMNQQTGNMNDNMDQQNSETEVEAVADIVEEPQSRINHLDTIEIDDSEDEVPDYSILAAEQALKEFCFNKRNKHIYDLPLRPRVNLADVEERDRGIVSFYKKKQEWSAPLDVFLYGGDVATGDGVDRQFLSTAVDCIQNGLSLNFGGGTGNKTKLLEGERDHLLPTPSKAFTDSCLFIVAGRIAGHSILHEGPRLCGLSRALVHVLFDGDEETAPVSPEDCPDMDVRGMIEMLLGTESISEDAKSQIRQEAANCGLPGPDAENRLWLAEKLLLHWVFEKRKTEILQLKCGIQETGVSELIKINPKVSLLAFPGSAGQIIDRELLLERIDWPSPDEEDFNMEEAALVSGFMRTFICEAGEEVLHELLKFWTGWEMLPRSLFLVYTPEGHFTSQTCFERLTVPLCHREFNIFKEKLLEALKVNEYGFGLV